MADLIYEYGTMNSGKTMQLIITAYNYTEIGKKVIVIKPGVDTKGANNIVSRTGLSCAVDYLIDKQDSIKEKINLKGLDVILVDEAQFFTDKQIAELYCISKEYDIRVICYGLKTDFQTNFFPGSKRLFELADYIEELTTLCNCGQKANFNARIVNGKYVFDGNQVAIDGEDEVTYKPLCGKCYNEKVLMKKKSVKKC